MVLNNLNRYARRILNKDMYFAVRKFYFSVRKMRYKKLGGGQYVLPVLWK